jgi:hypothetical protein
MEWKPEDCLKNWGWNQTAAINRDQGRAETYLKINWSGKTRAGGGGLGLAALGMIGTKEQGEVRTAR